MNTNLDRAFARWQRSKVDGFTSLPEFYEIAHELKTIEPFATEALPGIKDILVKTITQFTRGFYKRKSIDGHRELYEDICERKNDVENSSTLDELLAIHPSKYVQKRHSRTTSSAIRNLRTFLRDFFQEKGSLMDAHIVLGSNFGFEALPNSALSRILRFMSFPEVVESQNVSMYFHEFIRGGLYTVDQMIVHLGELKPEFSSSFEITYDETDHVLFVCTDMSGTESSALPSLSPAWSSASILVVPNRIFEFATASVLDLVRGNNQTVLSDPSWLHVDDFHVQKMIAHSHGIICLAETPNDRKDLMKPVREIGASEWTMNISALTFFDPRGISTKGFMGDVELYVRNLAELNEYDRSQWNDDIVTKIVCELSGNCRQSPEMLKPFTNLDSLTCVAGYQCDWNHLGNRIIVPPTVKRAAFSLITISYFDFDLVKDTLTSIEISVLTEYHGTTVALRLQKFWKILETFGNLEEVTIRILLCDQLHLNYLVEALREEIKLKEELNAEVKIELDFIDENAVFDCYDRTAKRWYHGSIVEKLAELTKIHYMGYSPKYDEWVNLRLAPPTKIAPLGTHLPAPETSKSLCIQTQGANEFESEMKSIFAFEKNLVEKQKMTSLLNEV